MTEGKELLYKILDNKLDKLSSINREDYIYKDTNLIELYELLLANDDNFYMVSNELLDKIVSESKPKVPSTYKKEALKLRDLLIGKKDYNLKISMTDDYKKIINTFTKNLRKSLEAINPIIINFEEIETKCKLLSKTIAKGELITDFDFIESLAHEYSEIDYDKNMLSIMNYINESNLNVLRSPKKKAPIFDIRFIRKPKINEQVLYVLDKLGVDVKSLPNYMLGELKKVEPEVFFDTYELIRKNKAEQYGILHLIKKENLLAKLVILLYSNKESIMYVVDSTKDAKGNVDINTLRILLNYIPTCFLIKNNEYFKARGLDYKTNIETLKEYGINFRALIKKTPLFMISDSEVIKYTLKYCENVGANPKNIINRYYKTLSYKPSLLIDNIEVLRKYNVNMEEYFGDNNTNYNLIKVSDLEKKLKYIIEHNNLINSNPLDYELINKLLVSKIYKDALSGKVNWGEE